MTQFETSKCQAKLLAKIGVKMTIPQSEAHKAKNGTFIGDVANKLLDFLNELLVHFLGSQKSDKILHVYSSLTEMSLKDGNVYYLFI